MCGIISVINKKDSKVTDKAIFGLKALEYRGYDSAGIAFHNELEIYKTTKSLNHLEQMVKHKEQNIAIAHTRWATHGEISIDNTHPININNACIVHNGIFENHAQIKEKINYKAKSKTDTEILLAYLLYLIKDDFSKENILKSLEELKNTSNGSFAAVFMFNEHEELFWIKKGISPLIAAKTDTGYTIASDECAVLSSTDATIHELPNETFGTASADKLTIYPEQNIKKYTYSQKESSLMPKSESWLEDEISQQKEIYQNAYNNYNSELQALHNEIKKYDSILLIACGSAYFAAKTAELWFEEEGISAKAEIASEWNCRKSAESKNTLVIFISQSGETADTLLALKKAQQMNLNTLAIINKEGSTIAKQANKTIYLKIGAENSVASTKAFTSQLIKLFELAKNKALPKELNSLTEWALKLNISSVAQLLAKEDPYKKTMIIGKNLMHILAQESALKLKELTYETVEAYAAGELKHGYIALVDNNTYAIGLAPEHDEFYQKCISNLEEIKTRKGKIILIANKNEINAEYFIQTPSMSHEISPFIYIIIMQRIALEVTKLKKLSIDRPRNLAKSITVI